MSVKQLKKADLDKGFLTSPGEDLVPKLLLQMSRVPAFTKLFGPYKVNASNEKDTDAQRWADYERSDWSLRQLPTLNAFEAQAEAKDSDNAFLKGTVSLQVFWPAYLRRSEHARIPATFKGILENFFASDYVKDMLDELYYVQRDCKVYGLNEFGKELTWTTNTQGVIDSEMVPVTMVDVSYRIDLRAWYRALEYMGRTKADPFTAGLPDLNRIQGTYDGVQAPAQSVPDVQVVDGNNVQNP